MKMYRAFENEDMKKFEAEAKIGLLATVSANGQPHISFISSLQAKTPNTLIWGQFSEGLSKKHVKLNPNTAFLIMTMEREFWHGKARWTHEAKQGPEYDMFNRKPMFRYNSYFGIHTVHYMDVVEVSGGIKLDLPAVLIAAMKTTLARGGAGAKQEERALSPWAEALFGRLDTLKFMAFVEKDGFPSIVPVIQCQKADANRLVFSPGAHPDLLGRLEPGTSIAVFGLTMQLENVLTRGVFAGYRRYRGISLGTIDIDWVYNSMPPLPGQIYPSLEVTPVTRF